MDELASLLAQINASGWRVNNLFQFDDGAWRCNLRFVSEGRADTRTYFHEYADAPTPLEAVQSAIWNMQQKRNDGSRVKLQESARLSMKRNEVARQYLERALAKWQP